ncbi:MAG: RNA polymerase subunit sigma-70 [Planctomycetes bacterium]|nr:RNA polymerase subunit sigma-70 [Planctomycetota bacterium]
MSSQPDGSVTHFFGQLRQGNRDAAQRLWEHFAPRLLGLARKTLAGGPQRIADEEDAVLDAFSSFCQRALSGDFVGDLHRDNLWSLLATITVRKARKQQRSERAQKRGGGRVMGESTALGNRAESHGFDEMCGQIDVQDFDLICEELLGKLDNDQRKVALLRLMSYTDTEIAEVLGFSVSKVERKLRLIRRMWGSQMED